MVELVPDQNIVIEGEGPAFHSASSEMEHPVRIAAVVPVGPADPVVETIHIPGGAEKYIDHAHIGHPSLFYTGKLLVGLLHPGIVQVDDTAGHI